MPASRVKINPEVIIDAIGYSQREEEIRYKFADHLEDWLSGANQPTVKQLDDFAREARVPTACLYGSKFPDMTIDIPDMRRLNDLPPPVLTPDLVDTVFTCQIRQDWYRDYIARQGGEPLDFVGSASLSDSPQKVARSIKQHLGWSDAKRAGSSAREYRDFLIDIIDRAGILVMVSGTVGRNHRRPLNPADFRGFAMSDPLAPLIFVNGHDWESAQVFTLAHELAHIWLNHQALSAPDDWRDPYEETEKKCNAIATELLVPQDELRASLGSRDLDDCIDELKCRFKVNKLVLYRAARELGKIDASTYRSKYRNEFEILKARWAKEHERRPRKNKNGEPSNHLSDRTGPCATRVGTRFAKAVYGDAKAGSTLYTEAYELLDVSTTRQLEDVLRGTGVDV